MASMTSRAEAYPVVDSDLFTFKPKLNEKSNEIAQNLLSNFYERQLKHTQRLTELVNDYEAECTRLFFVFRCFRKNLRLQITVIGMRVIDDLNNS